MQEWLETLKIDVPVIERSALLQQACEHFNALDIRRNDRHSATINSDDFFWNA